MKLKLSLLSIVLLTQLCMGSFSMAQVETEKDTLTPESSVMITKDQAVMDVDAPTIKEHSPKKALLMSAVVPGLGQIYNRKYWKAPIVWAGMGASIYMIGVNRAEYLGYKDSYIAKLSDDPGLVDKHPNMSAQGVRQEYDRYRTQMETFYVATLLFYVMNLVDATVDAHLFNFNVSDDLSMDIRPKMLPQGPMPGDMAAGVGLTLKFR